MINMNKYLQLARQWRRHLHQNPELSFQEFATSDYISHAMGQLNHGEILRPTPTGLIVAFRTGRPGPRIGLRADIDALPIQEQRPDLDFQSSRPGVMHACGHDGHSAVLMAACAYLNDHFDRLSGEIYAIFQAAEEVPPGGAAQLIASGALAGLDFIYGQHFMSHLPSGQIAIGGGPVTANADIYQLTIKGKGGHAAMPQQTIDPLLLGAQFVTLLQSLAARHPQEPLVISNTVFHGGQVQNVIADEVFLMGSVRSVSEEGRNFVRRQLEQLIAGLCAGAGAGYDFNYQLGYDRCWNEPSRAATLRALATEKFPAEQLISSPPLLVAEDFSAYNKVCPCCFALVGSGNDANGAPHHHPCFGLDEASFAPALELLLLVALNGERFA